MAILEGLGWLAHRRQDEDFNFLAVPVFFFFPKQKRQNQQYESNN